MEEKLNLTPEEEALLKEYYNVPMPQKDQTMYAFLNAVATSDDTTKVGYVTLDELGMPKHPIRTYKKIAHFCNTVADKPGFSGYFIGKSEIVTSTSLSKDGFLVNKAVTVKRELENIKKERKPSSSWFKKKEEKEETYG